MWQTSNNVLHHQQLLKTKLEGGLPQLHLAEDAAVQWSLSHGA